MTTQQFAMLFVQGWGSFTIHSWDEKEIIGSVDCLDQVFFKSLLNQWLAKLGIVNNTLIVHAYYRLDVDGVPIHTMNISYRPSIALRV